MPTRTGLATAVLAVLAFVAARVFGIFELYIVAAAMVTLIGCACVWVLLNRRSLHVKRQIHPVRLHVGTASTVTLDLSNPRMMPTPVARITDEVDGTVRADAHVPPLRSKSSTRASYRVPTERRGVVEVGPLRTRITDPFSLASVGRNAAANASLLVLPRIDRIAPPPQPGGDVAMQLDRSPNRVGAHGDDFSSLRAYEVGDDLRKVHWPSSARAGELVVRNEHVPEHGNTLVMIDVRAKAADEETFEHMVSAAASVLIACRERGDRMRLVTSAGIDQTADTARGYDGLLDTLALVEQVKQYRVALPFRVGRADAETGAMIVGEDPDPLLATLPPHGTGANATVIVRFYGEGATPQHQEARLPSGRMIDVRHGQDFAAVWTRALRR